MRLEKYSFDPARDASRKTELRPQDPRYWHLLAERKGAVDDRMQEFRWLLEEMRVSFFALELRPPPPQAGECGTVGQWLVAAKQPGPEWPWLQGFTQPLMGDTPR